MVGDVRHLDIDAEIETEIRPRAGEDHDDLQQRGGEKQHEQETERPDLRVQQKFTKAHVGVMLSGGRWWASAVFVTPISYPDQLLEGSAGFTRALSCSRRICTRLSRETALSSRSLACSASRACRVARSVPVALA